MASSDRPKPDFWSVFWGTSLALLAFSLVLLLIIVWKFDPISDVLRNAGGLLADSSREPLTNQENNALARLISIGAVLPAELLIQQISDFYTTIITVLVAIMAALSVVAYMYIRGKSAEAAQDAAELTSRQKVETYFASKEFADSVDDSIRKSLELTFYEYEEVVSATQTNAKAILEMRESIEEVEEISEALELLTKRVSELDREETEGEDRELVNGKPESTDNDESA